MLKLLILCHFGVGKTVYLEIGEQVNAIFGTNLLFRHV